MRNIRNNIAYKIYGTFVEDAHAIRPSPYIVGHTATWSVMAGRLRPMLTAVRAEIVEKFPIDRPLGEYHPMARLEVNRMSVCALH
jgi:hypothetical protein